MTDFQAFLTIAAIAFATMLTRFLPFLIFPENKQPPAVVTYLGKVLPAAMIGLLVVYCFKDVRFLQPPYGIPQAVGVLCVALLHLWKHNVLLSIGTGTAVYIVLLQFLF